ncbi:hypothetical protein E4U55_005380 [Claviceps digitariae]|nr:hypothetical protein E4U55_005380 [Claviceps digitariae]
MDSSVPMILPKGIVVNSTSIYQEVASYPVVPAVKIWEYWHVYTTTNKKLKDPTARRLENFWWQVWGSDRRYLSGQALARIYENISVGHAFVPLYGPPNRWEGPDIPPLTKQLIVAHLNSGHGCTQDQPVPPRMKSNNASFRSLSSSASKPPPPHPILKKSRSPFVAGGPRPTARFASPPPDSDREDTKESDFPSSGSTTTANSETVNIKSTKRRPDGAQKLMNASLASTPSTSSPSPSTTATLTTPPTVLPTTNRPVMNRNQSPQISMAMAGTHRAHFSFREPPSRAQTQNGINAPVLEQSAAAGAAGATARSESGEFRNLGNSMQSFTQSPRLSAKAAGKQPAVARKASNDLTRIPESASQATLPTAVSNHSNCLARNTYELRSPVSTRSISLTRTDTDSSSTTGSISDSSSMMVRSMTQNGYGRKPSTQGLFTSATATTTHVAAQGQIIDQAGSLPISAIFNQQETTGMVEADLTSRRSATSLIYSRMLPTQPSQVASVPMGRTRSQLKLLLEREKSRVGDKSRFRI